MDFANCILSNVQPVAARPEPITVLPSSDLTKKRTSSDERTVKSGIYKVILYKNIFIQ